MRLCELTGYLDTYLDHASIADHRGACNGLQVEGRAEVRRVAAAVDACAATITAAADGGADMLLVHHGLFWGTTAPVTGLYYQRLRTLLRAEIALYSSHLPLDVHAEVGNNPVLARRLGLEVGGAFAEAEGAAIGVWCDAVIGRDELVRRVERELPTRVRLIATGPAEARRVGIVTGGGGPYIGSAAAAGCDTLLTGEGAHHTYFDAEERGVNVLYAGHYATETVGVQALADHLRERLGLDTWFIDHPTGL